MKYSYFFIESFCSEYFTSPGQEFLKVVLVLVLSRFGHSI